MYKMYKTTLYVWIHFSLTTLLTLLVLATEPFTHLAKSQVIKYNKQKHCFYNTVVHSGYIPNLVFTSKMLEQILFYKY